MTQKKRTGKKGITLRDVIVHLQGVSEQLLSKIEGNTHSIAENTASIAQNTASIAQNTIEIKSLRTEMNQRFDALEEDLTATMNDTVKIRQHVGMAMLDH